jgi:hypothetical protein
VDFHLIDGIGSKDELEDGLVALLIQASKFIEARLLNIVCFTFEKLRVLSISMS